MCFGLGYLIVSKGEDRFDLLTTSPSYSPTMDSYDVSHQDIYRAHQLNENILDSMERRRVVPIEVPSWKAWDYRVDLADTPGWFNDDVRIKAYEKISKLLEDDNLLMHIEALEKFVNGFGRVYRELLHVINQINRRFILNHVTDNKPLSKNMIDYHFDTLTGLSEYMLNYLCRYYRAYKNFDLYFHDHFIGHIARKDPLTLATEHIRYAFYDYDYERYDNRNKAYLLQKQELYITYCMRVITNYSKGLPLNDVNYTFALFVS